MLVGPYEIHMSPIVCDPLATNETFIFVLSKVLNVEMSIVFLLLSTK